MARPVSWLKNLHDIRRRVAATVRSHYTRKELQELFDIKQSAAASLMEILQATKVANALLVARDDLMAFLERVQAAEDVPALMETMRAEKAGISRKKIRHLVQRDYDPMSVYGIPDALTLSRGKLEITFATVEDLSATLVTVALILQDDLAEFIRLYEPPREQAPQDDNTVAELRKLFASLERSDAAHQE